MLHPGQGRKRLIFITTLLEEIFELFKDLQTCFLTYSNMNGRITATDATFQKFLLISQQMIKIIILFFKVYKHISHAVQQSHAVKNFLTTPNMSGITIHLEITFVYRF